MLTCFCKELLDSSCTNANEHFIEVTTRAENKIAACLACDGSGKQCFASTWLSREHDSFEEFGTFVFVQLRILNDADDVKDFILDFVDALDVFETLVNRLGHLDVELGHLTQTVPDQEFRQAEEAVKDGSSHHAGEQKL